MKHEIPKLKRGEELRIADGVVVVGPSLAPSGCRRLCQGDRSNTESPAQIVTFYDHGNRKAALLCSCCQQPLRLDASKGAPAVNPAVEAQHRRFICDRCDYNVVLMGKLQNA